MPRPLFRRHDAASHTQYQEIKQLAQSQAKILAGTPGTLKQRTQSGKRYWVREHIRVDGRKVDQYLGPEKSFSRERIEAIRAQVDLAKALAAGSAKLRLLGFQRIDRKPAAVVEVFFNHGLNQAGLTLVGSHAYGVLLNELGVTAPGYKTQDIDVARAQPLAIALPHGLTFAGLLRESGLQFVPIPGMPSHRPSASFKLPGRETLAVDLLVPGNVLGARVAVDELRAHAQAIPLLDFLIADPLDSIVLSPNQVIPIPVPAPERFTLHKLFSSQSRKADRDKVRKDLDQAAVVAAVLEEDTPGLLADAFRRMPASGKPAVRRGALAAARSLEPAHQSGYEALLRIGKG